MYGRQERSRKLQQNGLTLSKSVRHPLVPRSFSHNATALVPSSGETVTITVLPSLTKLSVETSALMKADPPRAIPKRASLHDRKPQHLRQHSLWCSMSCSEAFYEGTLR